MKCLPWTQPGGRCRLQRKSSRRANILLIKITYRGSFGIYWREISWDLSISRDLQTKFINKHDFYTVFWSFSWDLVGSHEMGRSSPGGGGLWSTFFQSRESFSPFLLISWDSVRFVYTPPPPWDVLSISWDIQTTSTYPQENFSPSRGIPRDEEKFSWRGWGMG